MSVFKKEFMRSSSKAVIKYYGNTGNGFFKRGVQDYKRFSHKNQHTQRKLLNFENWVNVEVSKIGHHFIK